MKEKGYINSNWHFISRAERGRRKKWAYEKDNKTISVRKCLGIISDFSLETIEVFVREKRPKEILLSATQLFSLFIQDYKVKQIREVLDVDDEDFYKERIVIDWTLNNKKKNFSD